ncbi:hypothetical protein B4N89_40265 [Embleya scabrispora]|uniref:Carbohydrate kinase FGGY C-terminal domain-containing protein n=1 Tax=Embleya scabrispora TaxID=159449 RepID=A0A1T3NNT1_9ACTN|nr:FGGY-family carbohydrate kinase [Embleya scabrispora]OPC78392.1 hypothetical protein B4N89_40265 [Embleya scabrispora]
MDTLVCAGSPARSRLWCSIEASVRGVPVEVPAETDLAAYGAALAAGAGARWWPAPGPEPHPEYAAGPRRFLDLGDAAQGRASAVAVPTPPLREDEAAAAPIRVGADRRFGPDGSMDGSADQPISVHAGNTPLASWRLCRT